MSYAGVACACILATPNSKLTLNRRHSEQDSLQQQRSCCNPASLDLPYLSWYKGYAGGGNPQPRQTKDTNMVWAGVPKALKSNF